MSRRARGWTLAMLFIVGAGGAYALETANRAALDAQRDAVAFARAAQYRACERGNDLRRAVATNTRILSGFLAIAAEARAEQAAADLKSLNIRTARSYRELREQLHPFPRVDCRAAIYPERTP